MVQTCAEKLDALESLLRPLAPVALGFSGGVDSTFLAAVCARTIPDATLLVHLDSPFVGTPERTAHDALAPSFGLPARTIPFNPFEEDAVTVNGPDRCYLCKHAGFTRIIKAARTWAAERDIAPDAICVLDGSNADDAASTDRPGMRALAELGVRSPLAEVGLTKAEERALLRAWGISIWNMPAGACLATRVATGEPLTAEKIACARACEDYLQRLGCTQVRARIEGGELHIEASPEDLALITADDIAAKAERATPEADAHRTEKHRNNMNTDDKPAEASRLSGNIYAQLSALAQEAGIPYTSPIAHLYRRGSMNRQPRYT